MSTSGPTVTRALYSGVLIASAVTFPATADLSLLLEGHAFGSRQQVGYNTANLWDQTSSEDLFYMTNATQHVWSDTNGVIPGDIYTYCIELYQGVDVGETYSFSLTQISEAPSGQPGPGPMGIERAKILQDLYARNLDPVHGGVPDTTDGDVVASAMQMLIWEITHERFTATTAAEMVNQMTLELGAFQWNGQGNQSPEVQNQIALAAADMISSLGVGGFLSADIAGLTDQHAQDQVFQIPVPASICLLGGLLARGARRRRA
ncbi:MAG: hypothetical protein VX641_06025 [Planctomycetota bacterium]|nr:hypothetical protein [Planctomycetota bacterium]